MNFETKKPGLVIRSGFSMSNHHLVSDRVLAYYPNSD